MPKIYTQYHIQKQEQKKDYTGVCVLIFCISALFSMLAFLFAIIALCK